MLITLYYKISENLFNNMCYPNENKYNNIILYYIENKIASKIEILCTFGFYHWKECDSRTPHSSFLNRIKIYPNYYQIIINIFSITYIPTSRHEENTIYSSYCVIKYIVSYFSHRLLVKTYSLVHKIYIIWLLYGIKIPNPIY